MHPSPLLLKTVYQKPVDLDEVLSRICVRPPYFALRDLVADEEGVAAVVTPEQVAPGEIGPICAAEAGRHLAILGSCAAARLMDRGGRHYYLAQQATLERVGVGAPEARFLIVWASARFESKREARAQALLLTSTGQPLYRLDVSYSVLGAALFDRLFEAQRQDGPRAPAPAPYRLPLDLQVVERSRAGRVAVLAEVRPDMCAGHFDGVSALPVARVMGGLAQVGIDLLAERLERPDLKVSVVRAATTAENMAFAGKPIHFAVEHFAQEGPIHRLRCVAAAPDCRIGVLELDAEVR